MRGGARVCADLRARRRARESSLHACLDTFFLCKNRANTNSKLPTPPRKKKTGCNVKRGLLSSETWGAIEYSAKQDKGCVAPEEIARGVTRASAGRVGSGVGLGLPGDSPVL